MTLENLNRIENFRNCCETRIKAGSDYIWNIETMTSGNCTILVYSNVHCCQRNTSAIGFKPHETIQKFSFKRTRGENTIIP